MEIVKIHFNNQVKQLTQIFNNKTEISYYN